MSIDVNQQLIELRAAQAAVKAEISQVAVRFGERLDEMASKQAQGIDLTADIQAAKDDVAALHALAQPETPDNGTPIPA